MGIGGSKMAIYPFQYVNWRGIPTVESRNISVGDTVDFLFDSDWDRSPFRGLLLVNLSQAIPTGTTGTLPVRFTMAGVTSNVTTYNGANLTAADVPGTGVYLFYYDRRMNVLQIMGVTPTA